MASDKSYGTKYYHANKERLRAADNRRYAQKVAPKLDERREAEALLHPLLVSKGKKVRKGKVKSCAHCAKDFYSPPHRTKVRFCSNKCVGLYVKKDSERVCVVCLKSFYCCISQLTARSRKTCSVACRSLLYQQRAEARRLQNPESVKSVDRCLRYSAKMDQWRTSVFQRDNYTCQKCGARNGKGKGATYLEAHHIRQFATHPELRFDIANGITLCKPCHKSIPHIRNVKAKELTQTGNLK